MHSELRPLPSRDPISGKELIITELQTSDGEITLRGRFAPPAISGLNDEQARFLEVFLRCRGVLSSVQDELGLSYPTVRGRLDTLLTAMNLTPIRTPERVTPDEKARVLEQLENGEITPEEAKTRLRGVAHR
jgi:hypothetical protein